MTNFSVGPGVAQALADNNDEARSDEIFVIGTPGEKISQTFGSSGIYWWYESENSVKRAPFPG
jgi:hypothetical protein